MSWKTQTIDHEIRIQLGLSMNDYVLLDYIYRTQTSPLYGAKIGGWCDTPLSKIGEFFGLSKGALSGLFKKLVEAGFLDIDGKKRRTTEKWWGIYENKIVQKVNDAENEKSVKRSESEQNRSESERHTVVIKDKESLIAPKVAKKTKLELAEELIETDKAGRKLVFEKSLVPFLEKYDKTMLRQFADYWTESNYGKKKMRFQNETFFDIPRRLATWFARSKETIAKTQLPQEAYKLPKNLQRSTPSMDSFFGDAAKKMAV